MFQKLIYYKNDEFHGINYASVFCMNCKIDENVNQCE